MPFDDNYQSTGINPGPAAYGAAGGYPDPLSLTWQPRVDIFEGSDSFLIVVEVPGSSPEQLSVESEGNLLLISGQSLPVISSNSSSMSLCAQERVWGSFSRSVLLPPHAYLDQAEASCRNGLLEIRVPKKQSAYSPAGFTASQTETEPSPSAAETHQAEPIPKKTRRTGKGVKH